ncbi:MAG: hypothetical protein AAF446_10840, partial [Pseudomonadota bacterium]
MTVGWKPGTFVRSSIFVVVLGSTLVLQSVSATDVERPGQRQYDFNEHTPSYDEMVWGMRAYEASMFHAALAHFKNAARWADKFAQYNVGAMYLRGEGTDYDAARGWAWIELSAERGYPEMVDMSEKLWAMLSEPEQRKAMQIYQDEILPEYGDHLAIEKTALRMHRDRRQATGSRLGFASGFLNVYDRSGRPRAGTEFYAAEKWDFETIISYETQLAFDRVRGRV